MSTNQYSIEFNNQMIQSLFSKQFQSQINTPAVGAAYVIKRHIAQKSDNSYEEISLEVGELISIIEMPEDSSDDNQYHQQYHHNIHYDSTESQLSPLMKGLWRGKKVMINFSSQHHCKQFSAKVGFFPKECVQLIAKHSQHVHSSSQQQQQQHVAHTTTSTQQQQQFGRIANFFRSILIPRPSTSILSSSASSSSRRRRLKHCRITKHRVFGCDLNQYLINTTREIPLVLKSCSEFLELYGIVDGIYRLSGINSNIQRLRMAFDEDIVPDLMDYPIITDIHCVASLLKMYFRELPNPLLTFHLYDQFVSAINSNDTQQQTQIKLRLILQQLPHAHYRTLHYLMQHLSRVASKHDMTGMTPKNLAIVWAPNLLRSEHLESIGGGVEALHVIGTQAVLTEYLITFASELFTTSDQQVINTCSSQHNKHKQEHVFSVLQQKLIEVGEGVNGLKQFHTHINIDVQTNSKTLSPWKSLFQFSRSWSSNDHNKRLRRRLSNVTCSSLQTQNTTREDIECHNTCHSNDDTSDAMVHTCDTITTKQNKLEFRSHSCDSYFTRNNVNINETQNTCFRQSLCLNVLKRNYNQLMSSSQSSLQSSLSPSITSQTHIEHNNNKDSICVEIHNQMTTESMNDLSSLPSSPAPSLPSLPFNFSQIQYEEQTYSLDFSSSETDPSLSPERTPSLMSSLTPEQEMKTLNESFDEKDVTIDEKITEIIENNENIINERNINENKNEIKDKNNDIIMDSSSSSSCVRLLRSKFESNDNTMNDTLIDNTIQDNTTTSTEPLIQNRRQLEKRERIDKYKNERRAQIRENVIQNKAIEVMNTTTQTRVTTASTHVSPPIPAPRRINNYQHVTARVDTRWDNNNAKNGNNSISLNVPIVPRRLSLEEKRSVIQDSNSTTTATIISVRPLAKPSQQNNANNRRISALFMH